jgi:acetylglutamate synthase
MSDIEQKIEVEDVVEQLQDETLENVEVSDGNHLDEAKAAPEVDGAKAAEDDAAEIKKSAPAQATAPKTKAGMVNAMYNKMSKMKKEELTAAYMKMHAESVETDDAEVVSESHFDEDLDALVADEATLSEGFKGKAAIIFEAALKSKLATNVARLEESYQEELTEETTRIHSELVEKVDGYLNYVVENWMEENKLAVENGLRTEVAESFMTALHGVFTEHYVDVPESKVDLVDDLATKVDNLEEAVNVSEQKNIELSNEVKTLTRDAIVRESATGLSEAQAEKLKSLVEDVTYESADAFTAKVDTIKETYFKEVTKTTVSEEVEAIDESADEVSVSPRMQSYLAALKQTI